MIILSTSVSEIEILQTMHVLNLTREEAIKRIEDEIAFEQASKVACEKDDNEPFPFQAKGQGRPRIDHTAHPALYPMRWPSLAWQGL